LRAAFHFRHSRGDDSYSTRLLTHFLLHCGTGLKVETWYLAKKELAAK